MRSTGGSQKTIHSWFDTCWWEGACDPSSNTWPLTVGSWLGTIEGIANLLVRMILASISLKFLARGREPSTILHYINSTWHAVGWSRGTCFVCRREKRMLACVHFGSLIGRPFTDPDPPQNAPSSSTSTASNVVSGFLWLLRVRSMARRAKVSHFRKWFTQVVQSHANYGSLVLLSAHFVTHLNTSVARVPSCLCSSFFVLACAVRFLGGSESMQMFLL